MMTRHPLKHKPLFGLDIGQDTLRVMQVDSSKTATPLLIGYGSTSFDPSAIVNGIIQKPELIAHAAVELFTHHLVGHITTRRVAVATPKIMNDSHILLTRLLGLETVVTQTIIEAHANLFRNDAQSNVPTLLLHIGRLHTTAAVFDQAPLTSRIITYSDERVAKSIRHTLQLNQHQTELIKTKYGIGYSKKQQQIMQATTPLLDALVADIRQIINEHQAHALARGPIAQVMVSGEGAHLAGLVDYLTDTLRLAVRSMSPLSYMRTEHAAPIDTNEQFSYVAAAGLSLAGQH